MGLWAFRRQFAISDIPMMLNSSSFQVFTHTYDTNWIEENVLEDGSYRKINY